MIREKSILRKRICSAINEEDFETAHQIMSVICKDEQFTRRKWLADETEYLMHHVDALGLEKACKVVGKKLNRARLSVSKKYHSELKRLKEEAEKGLKMCQ